MPTDKNINLKLSISDAKKLKHILRIYLDVEEEQDTKDVLDRAYIQLCEKLKNKK